MPRNERNRAALPRFWALQAIAAAVSVAATARLLGWLDGGEALALAAGAVFAVLLIAWPRRPSVKSGLLKDGQPRREAASLARLETSLLDGLPDPYLLLDADRKIVAGNRAASLLFGRDFLGDDIALHLRHPEALAAIDRAAIDRAALGGERAAEITFAGEPPRQFRLRAVRLESAGEGRGRPTIALHLHDVSDIKQADEMRADFVANVSHELKTPLASLAGFIETLQGPASADAAARARFLGIMQGEAARMSRLIGDLLSLSRIERDERTPPLARTPLSALLTSVKDTMEEKARARKIALTLKVEGALPDIPADRDQLFEVFQNLIDNAIKYGRDGGSVTIVAGLAPDTRELGVPAAKVSIADDGPGIAREHLPRLTERFYRVDSARSRDLGGTGLGLAIVKHIVNRHRGRLKIASVPGEGSTFSVLLPLEAKA